jgi:DNA-binding NtrC family response regulator
MTGHRLAVVSEDAQLAGDLQRVLEESLGEAVWACAPAAASEHLNATTDGILLLVMGGVGGSEGIFRLVQEVYLRLLPPRLVLIQGNETPLDHELAHLDFTARFRWPADTNTLLDLIRETLPHVAPLRTTEAPSVRDVIQQRLLTHTPSLTPLAERLTVAATYDVTVLLTGETGTGKTWLARLLHECSQRRLEPFLAVPCGAIPSTLLESAFFGHVKGAFTGADRAREGKFAAAGNGTLLLDEIDTLELEQQAGLLRVIETGEYEPVGSNETRRSTARILVASNWDLEQAVRERRFREDLYYRLNVMSFHLPPLRERVQDIAPLVRAFTARYAAKFRKDLLDISPEALAAFESFPWPGNIRQLENFVQQAVLLGSGPGLKLEHLPEELREAPPVVTLSVAGRINGHSRLLQSREQAERTLIEQALIDHNFSRTHAASALGISRVTLYKKMKKYGLMSPLLRKKG